MTPARIVALLAKQGELTCAQIAEAFSVDPYTVSPLLRALRDEGKVKSKGNTRGTRWRAV